MSDDTTDYDEPSEVTRVARDLTAILDLAKSLLEQAQHKANNAEYLPGGAAMVALAPVANIEAWENQYETAESRGTDASHVADEHDEWEPPLQTLCFWSEQWRVEHNRESDRRPTLDSEAAFIRQVLNWAWETEPHFDDFAKDVNRARVRLENVLFAGTRAERTRVPCNSVDCDTHPRLIKIYGETDYEDRYKCPGCKMKYDDSDFAKAYAAQLRSEGAERFLPLRDAIGTLTALGRGERTIRRWLAPNEKHVADACPHCATQWKVNRMAACPDCAAPVIPVYERKPEDVVGGYCELATRKTFVWWPDLWSRHQKKAPHKRAA